MKRIRQFKIAWTENRIFDGVFSKYKAMSIFAAIVTAVQKKRTVSRLVTDMMETIKSKFQLFLLTIS